MLNIEVQKLLALWVPITFVAHLLIWTFVPIPNAGNEKVMGMLQTMLGLHGGWAAMIINYYFSSSASSARKDSIIAASAPPPRPPEAP